MNIPLTGRAAAALALSALPILTTACAGDPASPVSARGGLRPATSVAFGVPGAPLKVVATAGDRSATVRWAAPDNGGSQIIAYRVITEPYGNVTVVEPADTQVVVTGLANGRSWKFQVFATTQVGSGPRSAFSNSVVPGKVDPRRAPPGAPTGVTAVAGDAQATVSWAPPASVGGGAIQSYRVVANPGGKTVTVTPAPAGGIATRATLTGLTNGTPHTFTVAATNAFGAGASSAPSAPVTPAGPTVVPPPAAPPAPPAPPPPPVGPAGARWLMGYYVGYQRGLYPENSVDFSLMTHIIVGRIRPAADGSVISNFDIDDVAGPQMARTLATRAHQAGRRALLMLGGMGEHAGFVGAASAANRARFVANLLQTVDALGYDGIDVDWEPIEAADRAPLLALLRDLKAARPSLLLTVPVGYVNINFPQDADPWYAQLAGTVDRVNMMSYEMAGPWGGWVAWHHSALHDAAGNRPTSVASSAELYVQAGVPAAKLGIGMGFYGSCWRNVTQPRQALPGNVSMGNGDNSMSYANIMSMYFQAGARQWDAAAQVPYLSFATPRGPQSCNFVSYEDPQSIAAKGAYVKSRGLGGAIVWTINQGHLTAPQDGSVDPLLRAAYTSMVP